MGKGPTPLSNSSGNRDNPSKSPSQGIDPSANTRAVIELSKPKILNHQTVGGWHGTSEAALRLAISVGGLRGSPIPHAGASAGHLFFYKPQDFDFIPDTNFDLQALGRGGASGYARLGEQCSRIMAALGRNFKNPAHHSEAADLRELILESPRQGRERLLSLGLDESKADALLDGFRERAGFIIALSPSIIRSARVSDGDCKGEDYKIFLSNVLPFTGMTAILPLGIHEQSFIKSLRDSTPGAENDTDLNCGFNLPVTQKPAKIILA